jgi:hypothetical protein
MAALRLEMVSEALGVLLSSATVPLAVEVSLRGALNELREVGSAESRHVAWALRQSWADVNEASGGWVSAVLVVIEASNLCLLNLAAETEARAVAAMARCARSLVELGSTSLRLQVIAQHRPCSAEEVLSLAAAADRCRD